eukprot:SAG11_NODE_4620_length_1832_cov_1.500866_3_plen_186_part_00
MFSVASVMNDSVRLPPRDRYNDDCALFIFPPDHPIRMKAAALSQNTVFDSVVLFAIVAGTVILALEGPKNSLDPDLQQIFDRVNDLLFLIFLIELLTKVMGYGFCFTPEAYLKDPWNKIDFAVIVGSFVNYLGGDAGLVRLLRCFRPLRIINRNEGMRVIISAVRPASLNAFALPSSLPRTAPAD